MRPQGGFRRGNVHFTSVFPNKARDHVAGKLHLCHLQLFSHAFGTSKHVKVSAPAVNTGFNGLFPGGLIQFWNCNYESKDVLGKKIKNVKIERKVCKCAEGGFRLSAKCCYCVLFFSISVPRSAFCELRGTETA